MSNSNVTGKLSTTLGDGSHNRRVELVWNKGIAQSCDRRFPDEFPEYRDYCPVPLLASALATRKTPDNLFSDPFPLAQIRDGELVWVRLSWLKSFVRQVLPLVNAKFVLVTGDSDNSVPSELGDEANTILKSDKIIHWFAQNYDGSSTSGRVSPIPIGMDFHTLSHRPAWGEAQSCPIEQEDLLKSIRDTLPPLVNRLPKVYLDFSWQRSLGIRHYRRYHSLKGTQLWVTRRRTVRRLRTNDLVFCQDSMLPRNEMWSRRGRYVFVLSRYGMGLDCHRTWKALALGHIVLVPSSALDPLFQGLPFVALQSWKDITPEHISRWLSQYSFADGNDKRLTTGYWIQKIRFVARTATLLHHDNGKPLPVTARLLPGLKNC